MKKIIGIALALAVIATLGFSSLAFAADESVTVEWHVDGTGTVSHAALFNDGDCLWSSVEIDVVSGWNKGKSVASGGEVEVQGNLVGKATFSTNWTAVGEGKVDLKDLGALDIGKNNQAQLTVDYAVASLGSQSVQAWYPHRFIVNNTAEVGDGSILAFLQHDPQNGGYPTVINTTNLNTDDWGKVVQTGNTFGSKTEHDISASAQGNFTMDSTSVGEVTNWPQKWTIELTAEGNDYGVLSLNTETNKSVGTFGEFLTGALSDSQSEASFDVSWGYQANFSGTAFGHHELPAPGDTPDIAVLFSRDVVGSGSDAWDVVANWVQIGGSFDKDPSDSRLK